ncbi:MAG TPA: hypothetical protein VNK73_04760 [Actinomycetota bacterium]|jgi:hypothetical protein|nr:hypothetical protein [Actinomycetota bacterium]
MSQPQAAPHAIEKGAEVRVRGPRSGESGTWKVVGQVSSASPDDPAYDVTNLISGRRRIFRSSRLVVLRPARS